MPYVTEKTGKSLSGCTGRGSYLPSTPAAVSIIPLFTISFLTQLPKREQDKIKWVKVFVYTQYYKEKVLDN
jgi:hypothetical protein